ncbi:MAG TPA: hypothetical protein PLJ21_01645 [Pseudobdellovibrionaceae bacterium]|nr:hypothetical protein [Pseudobdellovibrionaceae bacterium]
MSQEIVKLDYFFPFIVFFTSLFILVVLETGLLDKITQSAAFHQSIKYQSIKHTQQRSGMYWIFFFISGIWSLQNLYLY